MTDMTLPAPRSAGHPFAGDPVFAATGLMLALAMVPTLAAMALDSRLFQGDSVWLKPLKFELALSVYALSLAFFAQWLPDGMTGRRSYQVFRAVVVAAMSAEMIWIAGAAMFGTASHYNVSTPLWGAIYGLMGVAAVTLTSASLVLAVAIWRNRDTGLPGALHLSIVLGLALTFLLTVPVAGTLSSLPGHFIGTPVTGAAVPLMGWSREVGDLRLPHFLATHALHLLPLAGLLATAALPANAARVAVWAATALFTLAVVGSFALAMAGLPVFPA